MNRQQRIITRAAELIKFDERGKVTNAVEVCKQIEHEFESSSGTAYRYIIHEAATVARRKRK